MSNYAARFIALFVYIYREARSREEIRRRESRRAGAYDGYASAVLFGGAQLGEYFVITLAGGYELDVTDIYRAEIIEVARALAHAAVRADETRGKGQRVLLQDDLQRLFVALELYEADILGDILVDRAAALTRSHIAVEQRYPAIVLAGGDRLDGL